MISYVDLLIFLNTFCILIVFGMSFSSLGSISQFLDSALMVRYVCVIKTQKKNF